VSILLLLAAAATGLCPLPEPAPARDAEGARVYLEVGDAEVRRGSAETAIVAYREALRLDSANVRVREAYLAACTHRTPAALLGEGIRMMNAGDCDGAIAVFQRLRTGRADAAAGLYEGICRYEQGDDERARPLLIEAQSARAHAARARYFLGLIDLRDGAASDAAELFDQVAASAGGTLGERAEVLRSAALRSGRGVVGIDAESGYDSNVNFTPAGGPASGDGAAAGGIWLLLRPLGLSGPYVRGNAFYRSQMNARDRDLGVFGGHAGWRVGRAETYGFADYGYDHELLGAAPYFHAHRGRVGGRWQVVNRVALSSVYTIRFETYETATSANYSGVSHAVDPELSFRFPAGSSISVGYHGGRDATSFSDTTSWEHGPRAAIRLVVLPTLRVGGEASYTSRGYDAAAVGRTGPRADRIFYAGSTLEKDFARFTLRLQAGYRVASSNDPAHSFSRLVTTLGASYTVGLF
jgi:hypothetical protein